MRKLPIVLFRRGIDLQHEEEFKIACEFFPVVELRSQCPEDRLVVGRFSTLPFYEELEQDLNAKGSMLINSPSRHRWIANMDWAWDLARFTPMTYYDNNFHQALEGPYVVKGRTNSRKAQWDTHMFAANKARALQIAGELMNDPLIGPQGVVYRQYVPLVTYEFGLNGLPFTNEWRFFYYKGRCLTYGRYWTTASEPERAVMDRDGMAFADKVAFDASDHVDFFVLDIAQRTDGSGWILIEVNDGQQSGISGCSTRELYLNLKEALK